MTAISYTLHANKVKTVSVPEQRVARLYELKSETAIKHWVADDREQRQADWQAERKAIHSLGERRLPLRGQFSAIGKDVFYADQPQFYLLGLGISGLTFKPFARVRLASSFMHLHVDLGDSLKGVSKNRKRKAIRYGRIDKEIDKRCSLAVRDYLKR